MRPGEGTIAHHATAGEAAIRDSPIPQALHDARDWAFAAGVALLLGVLFQLGVPLRGSFGANVTGDEPFYLLTTESLLSDGDLDLTNQYATEAYRRFFDGDGPLWYQSAPTVDGRHLSPHNIGLSVLVLPAYAVGGVAGVKAFLALLGGLTAGWTYLLCRRAFAGRRGSLLAVLLLGVSAPFFVHASQIYPEMPAALLTTIVVWLNLGPRGSVWRGVVVAAMLAGLMWLGAKYAPLAGVLGGLALLRLTWHGHVAMGLALVPLGIHYIWLHLATYGGLTPYAVNLVYAGSGTLELVARHVEVVDRLYRLVGLWADREFGLVRWAPILLLAFPGAWLVARYRDAIRWHLLAPIVAAVLVATFAAITMRGWWFPGRMLVTVLPLMAPLIAVALEALGERSAAARSRPSVWRGALILILAAGTASATLGLWSSATACEVTMAVNPFDAGGPWLEWTRPLFPLYTSYTAETALLSAAWVGLAGVLVWAVARTRIRVEQQDDRDPVRAAVRARVPS